MNIHGGKVCLASQSVVKVSGPSVVRLGHPVEGLNLDLVESRGHGFTNSSLMALLHHLSICWKLLEAIQGQRISEQEINSHLFHKLG